MIYLRCHVYRYIRRLIDSDISAKWQWSRTRLCRTWSESSALLLWNAWITFGFLPMRTTPRRWWQDGRGIKVRIIDFFFHVYIVRSSMNSLNNFCIMKFVFRSNSEIESLWYRFIYVREQFQSSMRLIILKLLTPRYWSNRSCFCNMLYSLSLYRIAWQSFN